MLGICPAARLDRVWATVQPWVTQALADVPETAEEVEAGIRAGGLVLWLVLEESPSKTRLVGHAVTLRRDYPERKELFVVTVGGEPGGKAWIPLLHSHFTEQVRAGHFDAVVASCRPGMMRWLSALGWKVRRYQMEW